MANLFLSKNLITSTSPLYSHSCPWEVKVLPVPLTAKTLVTTNAWKPGGFSFNIVCMVERSVKHAEAKERLSVLDARVPGGIRRTGIYSNDGSKISSFII
ncbi:hypothetical protein GIB67_041360 [Kingdonia uniflora]|uniref:Uncharacterized protein n=1 Tax=Kingdonia uniflora TaxID=39325 RepID=A0A7J7NIT8_9MAGN|nr:hypothetical protein GIB67_041360 [Kingdonia uniflora]